MIPEELRGMTPLKLPLDAWRDHKKLTKFLGDVEKSVNKQIAGVTKMMDTFTNELMARPTYAETYWNFKLNMKHKHVPGYMEEF